MSDLVEPPAEPSPEPPAEPFEFFDPRDYRTQFPRRGRRFNPNRSPLAYIMYQQGWTIDAFAKASGMNLEQVRRYVNGQLRIHPNHLAVMAQILGVDPQIIDFIPPPEQTRKKEIDYDVQLENAWRKIKLGVDPQVVLEEFQTSQQFFGLVKRFIRMLVKINEEFNEVLSKK